MSGPNHEAPADGPHRDLIDVLRTPGHNPFSRIETLDPSQPKVREYIAKTLHHEHGLAELFAILFGDLFIEVPGLGIYAYERGAWRHDPKGRSAMRACASLITRLNKTLPSHAMGEEAAAALRKLLKRALNGTVVRNIVSKYFNEQNIVDPYVEAYELDKDPSLLNTPAGVYNLRTGAKLDHTPDLLLSAMTKHSPDFDADTPLWDTFLMQIANGDLELVTYLQRVMGYALTGETKEEVFHLLYGTGGNGKSTFLRVLHDIMGDYASVGTPQLVSGRFGEGARFELARLAGKRAMFILEGVHGHTLDAARLKLITSGGDVVAESKYKDPVTIRNRVKILIASNAHMPYGTRDGGIERRTRVIHFTATFGNREKGFALEANQDLLEHFAKELPGILAKSIRESQVWYAHGLPSARTVDEETRKYLDISDPLGAFLEYCVVESVEGVVTASQMHTVFNQYARQHRLAAMNHRALKVALEERGYHQKRRSDHNVWVGTDLTPEGISYAKKGTGGEGGDNFR
jgi:putative DNA primase/helicase